MDIYPYASVIEVIPQNEVILEINSNPIPIKGEKGDNFTSNVYIIDEPSPEWIINHNKGYYPSIIITDIFNKEIKASIQYISINQVKINFSSNRIGKVIVN